MNSIASQKPLDHFAFIDALRGPAAILVMIFHLHLATRDECPNTGFNYLLNQLFEVFDLGKFAVVLFFMVSGFLIPTSLDNASSVKAFAIRRFWRLYPCYWLSIAIVIVLGSFHVRADAPLSPKNVVANLTMAQGYLGYPNVVGAFWTLQIELTFYCLCAVLFLFRLVAERRIYLVHISILIALLMAIARFAMHKPLPVALFLALAMMFAADGLRRNDPRALQGILVSQLGIVPVCLFAYGDLAPRYIVTYFMATIVFLLAMKWRLWTPFQSACFRFMGNISYGVYLLHGPIGITIASSLAQRGCSQGIAVTSGCLASIAMAWPVFRFIEEPCICIGRIMSQRPKPNALTPAESG